MYIYDSNFCFTEKFDVNFILFLRTAYGTSLKFYILILLECSVKLALKIVILVFSPK